MVDEGWTTMVDGRTAEHGYTRDTPCEPESLGELIRRVYDENSSIRHRNNCLQ